MNWKQLLVTLVSLIVIAAYSAQLLHWLETGALWVKPQYQPGYYLTYAQNPAVFDTQIWTDVFALVICVTGIVVIWTL